MLLQSALHCSLRCSITTARALVLPTAKRTIQFSILYHHSMHIRFPQLVFRPVVTGERIRLMAKDGKTVLQGIVETIMPIRTVVRGDDDSPVAIPNSVGVQY